jgi:hypothetical protein
VGSLLFAALSLATARSAHANPSARLVYARDASAMSCPAEDALRKAVAARFGYDPFFAWAKKTVVVLVTRDGGVYSARLEVIDGEGVAQGSREISSDGDSCSELFDVAALAISIALDASMAEAVPLPPASSPDPPALPLPDLPSPTPAPPDRQAAERRRLRLAVGLDGLSVSAGMSPRPALGGAAFAELREADALSLGLELYGDRSLDADATPNASVKTSLLAVDLVPCLRWGPFRTCGLLELGWLRATGEGLQLGASEGSFIAAGGARLAAEWALGAGLFVRVHADGVVVLNELELDVDYRFFWQTSHLSGALAAGAGFRFP